MNRADILKYKLIMTEIIIFTVLLILLSIGMWSLADSNKKAAEDRDLIINAILEEAINDAVERGYMDDSLTARIKHQIKEQAGKTIEIEGTATKRESGEEIYIRVQTIRDSNGNKSYYIAKKIE